MGQETTRTGLLIVTHGQIGRSLIDVAEFILGESLDAIEFIPFRQSGLEQTGKEEIAQAISRVDQGLGVLVLADIGGASPCNKVISALPGLNAVVLSGLNLAMLLRTWNYRSKPMAELLKLATEGAIRDIRERKK